MCVSEVSAEIKEHWMVVKNFITWNFENFYSLSLYLLLIVLVFLIVREKTFSRTNCNNDHSQKADFSSCHIFKWSTELKKLVRGKNNENSFIIPITDSYFGIFVWIIDLLFRFPKNSCSLYVARHLTFLSVNKRPMDFEEAREMGWIGKAYHHVGRWTRVADWVLYV